MIPSLKPLNPGKLLLNGLRMFEEFLKLASELSKNINEGLDRGFNLTNLQPPPLNKVPRQEVRVSLIAVDAASASLHTALGEVAVVGGVLVGDEVITVYPKPGSLSSSVPFVGALYSGNLPFVTDEYLVLRKLYREDPFLPEGAISSDLRMNMEVHLIEEAAHLGLGELLMIDGPATYPFIAAQSSSAWAEEIGRLNEMRVKAMLKAFEEGLTPICIVKRVWGSSHLPQAQELGVMDVVYVVKLARRLLDSESPVAVGPFEVRERAGVPDRIMTYLLLPYNGFLKDVGVLRFEVLRDIAEELGEEGLLKVMSSVAQSALKYGLYLPRQLYIADRISKDIVKRVGLELESALRRKGIPLLYSGGLNE